MSGSKYHLFRAIIGSPAKRNLNGVSLACQWWPIIECCGGSFVIFQGIRISLAKKPYIFVIFQGGSGPPVPPSGSAHGEVNNFWSLPSCVFIWVFRLQWRANFFWQTGHSCGLSPVWSSRWFLRLVCLLKPRLHTSHLKGQEPSCTYMWLLRSPGVGKDFSQSLHLWGFSWNVHWIMSWGN